MFAVDLLGFGWSDKPLVEYSRYDLWPRQLSTFIKEVIQPWPATLLALLPLHQAEFASSPAREAVIVCAVANTARPPACVCLSSILPFCGLSCAYNCNSCQCVSAMQVIGEPAVVAGNSLGGYASLATAVRYPDAVKGVVLLNAAGRFEEVKAEAQTQVEATLPNNKAGQEAKEALREVRL